MTLLDLFRLLRRYIVLVIALPVASLAICGAVLYLMPSSGGSDAAADQVQARIIVNSQVQPVAGLAASEGRKVMAEDDSVMVEAKADTATMTITITVSNAGEGAADLTRYTSIANSIADKAVATAEDMYKDNEVKDSATVFKAQVEPANPNDITAAAQAKKGGGKMKYLLVALLAGLFVAICIVVVIDLVRRPVKSIEGVQDAVELPVLEKLPVADEGERLLANVRFASKKDNLESVCIVPVRHAVLAEQASEALAKAAENEGLKVNRLTIEKRTDQAPALADGALSVIRCGSLLQGMSAAYAGQHSDAVLLAVSQWSDSLKELESAVAELKLADTNLVGIVFAPEVKSK